MEAWRAEERVLDGGESRPPVVSSVGRAWRRGHDCGRLVGRLIGCVGGRGGRGGGAQQVSQADGRQVATSTPLKKNTKFICFGFQKLQPQNCNSFVFLR